MKGPKVVVIGLDGATFTLLKPWMEAGILPFLKSIMDEGVHGSLESTIPPVTSPAWQCFMTGKNPGKLGIAGFFERQPEAYSAPLVGTSGYEGTTLWEILSRAGKRPAVLNVPFTAPSPTLNGVMIGGFTTPPSRKRDYFHPPGLFEEIEQKFGDYRMDLNTPPLLFLNRSQALIDELLEDCEALTTHQFEVAAFVLERGAFDLVMMYQLTTDRLQHRLWHLLDETHPWHDRATAQWCADRLVGYYRRLDTHIARLVQTVDRDPTVFVVSDHGFGPVVKGIDLNSWLLREGFIQIRAQPISQLKLRLWQCGWGPYALLNTFLRRAVTCPVVKRWLTKAYISKRTQHMQADFSRLANRLFLSLEDVDWLKTKAYCQIGPGLIRINLEGREPRGAVMPQDYHAVRQELVERLHALRDPTTGRTIQAQVVAREEAYQGRYLDRMPDIVYMAYEDGYMAGNPVAFISDRVIIGGLGPSGFHRMDGILLAKGGPLRKGQHLKPAHLMDIAPTLLYLMGCEVPKDMDGQVLKELFEEGFLMKHPITFAEAAPEGDRPAVDISADDQMAILNRLKGLGYID